MFNCRIPVSIVLLMLFFLWLVGWYCIDMESKLNTRQFGISRFEAAKLKESCEKSLPRDEKCAPKLTYEVK